MAQTTQLQQAAPPPSSVGAGTAAPAAAGAAQAQPPPVAATTPVSNPSTPQPPSSNNNNNNNNNNSVVSPAGNNNNNVMAAPVHAFTPAGQPIYNLCTPMPAHGGHPHAGGHYAATMLQAPISSSVYVNQVTANVNLHGWSHSVPAYIPGAGQAHYMPHGDMPQDQQGNPLMQQLQQVPINLATQGVSPNQHNPNMGGRGRLRGRGGRGGPRRNDYHPRHLQQQQQQQQQLIPLPPQQQLQQDSAGAGAPNMQLQPEHQLVAGPPDGQMQPVPYYPHPYTYGPYPAAYFAPQHAALQAPPNAGAAAAAQQVTGPPIYMPFMYPNAMYNCMGGYVYQHLIPQPEYPYVPEDGSQPGGVDERGQQPDGGMPQIWHPGPMYAEEYADVLQQQQQQQQQQQVSNPNGAPGLGDELNHNNFSLPSSETGSMLSPSCSVYEASIHEMQHQMGVMQIYDDGQMASLQTIHPGAGPVQQYVDELAECVVGPPGAIPVEWAAPIPMAGPAGMLPPPPQWQAGQEWQQPPTVAIEQQQQPQMIQPQPPQAPTPTPQQQPPHQDQLVVEKNLMNNNNEVPLEEILSNEKQQQIEMEYQQQQQQQAHPPPQQQQQLPQQIEKQATKVAANLVVATVAQQQQQQQQQAAPQHHQQQQTSPVVVPQQQQQQQQQHHHQQQPQTGYHEVQHQQSQQQHQQHQQQQQAPQQQVRKPPQQYNQSQQHQVRRKYSSEYNHHHQGAGGSNSSETGIQTTKTMSWTNSAQHKKSTQSVSVTASPNNVNNGPGGAAAAAAAGGGSGGFSKSGSYSHSTKTYTNQQHYQQQHYQNNYTNNSSTSSNSSSNAGGNNNSSSSASNNQQQQQQQPQQQQQQPQVRTYGTMKVPSSPVASNAPLLERKNSQQGGATVAAAATTTSTASITATPSHFQQQETSNATATAAAPQQQQQSHYHQQQQQQPQPATQQQYAAPPAAATKTYSSYAAKRQHTVYEQPALSSVVSASASSSTSANTQPQLNLAPPAPPASQSNQNSSESSQPSWASLFANKKPVAKVAPYEANKPTPAPAPLPVLPPVQQLAPPQPQLQQAPPKPQLKPQPQLQPQPKLQPLLPAPTAHQQLQLPAPVPAPITPLITPGTLSYSAASAQAMPAPSPSASIKPLKPEPVARPAAQLDEWTNKYADFLTRQKTNLAPISLRPRGLTNRSNYCYINSILQALLGCSPFYNLLRSIPKQAAVLSDVKTPTVNAMMSFMTNFSSLPSGLRLRLNTLNKAAQNKGKDEFAGTDLQCDIAFEPTDIYKLWNDSREEHVEGRQEDAEEFLGYVLNKLNDEMLEVIKLIAKPVPQQNGQEQPEPEDGGEVWQMICNNRNKGSVTRQTDFGRTPISDIFRGELRSRLQREGEHSTDVIQPFFTLQLNIEKAASVKEALEILVGRDQLEGVTGSKTKQEVVAWQQMTLEKLPVVLILHLKYFDYRSDGCTKILKKVEFPAELKIDAKILGSKKISQKQRAYRLFAVVYHDGKEASKGHYITDVFHTGYNNWLRYDDSSVKPISEKQVLQPHTPRVPYLLYYRRSDTIQHTTQPHQQQANGGGASGGVVGGSTSNSDANK
ncbi:trithorax group protein osa isoform X8 [Drosophila subobscura]|uniref:trithorax group protein osa isoform X8 n=1 Tax=Drosophila subobscura TaxID=7241 RepID=UPI00155ADBCE|nr:trithorax group protein osa isoform X8 [Drosophila subobscura]